MKENLSERYASLCNTNNFYQMESSELAFPPKICISDWRHAGHHLVVHVLSHGPIQNIFPGGCGCVRGIFKFSGGIQNIFGMRNFILCKFNNFKFSRRRGGGHNPQLKPPLDLRMYTVRREGGKGAVTYTSSLVGKR